MKKGLAIIVIVLSLIMLVSCGDEKKDVKATPSPTPKATDEGVDFEDLLDNAKTPGSATSTPKTSTSTYTPAPEVTNTPKEDKTPGPTDIPDFDDDNWTGLY